MNKLQRFTQKNIMVPTGTQKADFWSIDIGGGKLQYCQYGRIYLNGSKGVFFKLCGDGFPYKPPLTEQEQKEYTSKYSNVTFFRGTAEYAPEMRFTYLFLADKAINLQKNTIENETGGKHE